MHGVGLLRAAPLGEVRMLLGEMWARRRGRRGYGNSLQSQNQITYLPAHPADHQWRGRIRPSPDMPQ